MRREMAIPADEALSTPYGSFHQGVSIAFPLEFLPREEQDDVRAITVFREVIGRICFLEDSMNMRTVFLGSGLVTAGLGLLIHFGRSSTQELDGLMLLLIGVVFLSVSELIEAISLSQKETRKLLEKILKESQQRSGAGQKDLIKAVG